MNLSPPAILIAGTGSGCGKTTATLGIMAALRARGVDVQPYKCGPDFIDPTLHQMVTGRISRNLDIRMCGRNYVENLFGRTAPRGKGSISVIEGVMGLFDGGEGSGAAVASALGVPVVLVVNISSAAESVAAVVKGFETLDKEIHIAAVILNRSGSARHASLVREAIERQCQARVAGIIPRDEGITIPSRHLGLAMGHESPLNSIQMARLADLVEKHIDLDLLGKIALTGRKAPQGNETSDILENLRAWSRGRSRVRIGVAHDAAFCFYYRDNMEMLQACGAETVEFSPLDDCTLPEGLDGLYLGGGYPELFGERLSENKVMRREIARFCESGRPVFGECGGFMYLTESITDADGGTFPMTGVFPFKAFMQKRLRSLGYREPVLTKGCMLGKEGSMFYGHEFHYSYIKKDTERRSTKSNIEKIFKVTDKRSEGYLRGNTLAGYIHLHWGRTPEAARYFSEACRHREIQ